MTTDDIVLRASGVLFGQRLVTNVFRSVLVEAMVDAVLSRGWAWCSADYASCDFKHANGVRLEVKQSAMRQTWTLDPCRKVSCSWDIAARTKRWEDGRWIHRPGRNADIYVFALHPVTDETADHRVAQQWQFYVIAAERLPDAKRLTAEKAERLSELASIDELGVAVDEVRTRFDQSAE